MGRFKNTVPANVRSDEDKERMGEAQMERERSAGQMPLSLWTVRVEVELDVSATGPREACQVALLRMVCLPEDVRYGRPVASVPVPRS